MNGWIQHCKEYAKKHKCSYKDAMKRAKSTYKKGSGVADVLLDPERLQRKEQDGQNFLNDLERRVQARDGAYGKERMQRTMVKTKGKKESKLIDKATCQEIKKSYVKPHCRSKRKLKKK